MQATAAMRYSPADVPHWRFFKQKCEFPEVQFALTPQGAFETFRLHFGYSEGREASC